MLLRLALTRGHIDVEADNVTRLELPLGNLLGASSPVNDGIIAVNEMSLDFVGKDTFDGVALELFSNLLDDIGHVVVGSSLSNFALSSLEGVPSSENDVCLAASDRSIANNDSPGGNRRISIEVSANDTILQLSLQSDSN